MSKRRFVCGVGVNDWNSSIIVNGREMRESALWRGVLNRSFSEKRKTATPTYKDVTCCDEWLSLTKFIEDIRKMKGWDNPEWQLDKDIMFKGNKLYSKETCCFVPRHVNSLFTTAKKRRGVLPIGVSYSKKLSKYTSYVSVNNRQKHLGAFNTPEDAFLAYKKAKEAEIKRVANMYKVELESRVFDALMKYEVDIVD